MDTAAALEGWVELLELVLWLGIKFWLLQCSREMISFIISPVSLISFSSTKIHSKNRRHLAFWFYIMELLAESKLTQSIAS